MQHVEKHFIIIFNTLGTYDLNSICIIDVLRIWCLVLLRLAPFCCLALLGLALLPHTSSDTRPLTTLVGNFNLSYGNDGVW